MHTPLSAGNNSSNPSWVSRVFECSVMLTASMQGYVPLSCLCSRHLMAASVLITHKSMYDFALCAVKLIQLKMLGPQILPVKYSQCPVCTWNVSPASQMTTLPLVVQNKPCIFQGRPWRNQFLPAQDISLFLYSPGENSDFIHHWGVRPVCILVCVRERGETRQNLEYLFSHWK